MIDKAQFEMKLKEEIDRQFSESLLFEPIAYALLGEGKRIRSLIVLLIGNLLNLGHDVYPSAIAMEFAHTSSLILDDLPTMDNDAFRRGRPSLHKAFSEPIALMTSVALISESYQQIYLNGKSLARVKGEKEANLATMEALKIISYLAGANGAPNGQLLDVQMQQEKDPLLFEKMIYQKTGTLFEASFILGWLFGGGEMEKLNLVQKAATSFGRLFQIADDISDLHKDKNRANYALFLGEEVARQEVEKEKKILLALLSQLNLSKLLPILCQSLEMFLLREQSEQLL